MGEGEFFIEIGNEGVEAELNEVFDGFKEEIKKEKINLWDSFWQYVHILYHDHTITRI